jgi:hypothetical protein
MHAQKLKESVPNGRELTDYCLKTLQIRPTMLAGLLNITERTLTNWQEVSDEQGRPNRFDRLRSLESVVRLASDAGVSGRVILNLINEPIPGDLCERSLLYYIVDEPNNGLLRSVALQLIDSFKK